MGVQKAFEMGLTPTGPEFGERIQVRDVIPAKTACSPIVDGAEVRRAGDTGALPLRHVDGSELGL